VPGLPVGTPTGRPTRPTALAHRPPRPLTAHSTPSPATASTPGSSAKTGTRSAD
jgi:hypothetical protein